MYMGRLRYIVFEYSNFKFSSSIKISPKIINREKPTNNKVGPFEPVRHNKKPAIRVPVDI
tara:strand:+ start:7072 stop:7251 length:180 start_codon:yes stop_codon:yes gene_type:complete